MRCDRHAALISPGNWHSIAANPAGEPYVSLWTWLRPFLAHRGGNWRRAVLAHLQTSRLLALAQPSDPGSTGERRVRLLPGVCAVAPGEQNCRCGYARVTAGLNGPYLTRVPRDRRGNVTGGAANKNSVPRARQRRFE